MHCTQFFNSPTTKRANNNNKKNDNSINNEDVSFCEFGKTSKDMPSSDSNKYKLIKM